MSALRAKSRSKAEALLLQRYPDAPWLHRPEWAQKKLTSGAERFLFVTGIVATICTVASAPVIALLPAEIRRGGGLTVLFCLLFAMVALTALACFVYSLSRWKKFGRATLTLATVPVVPGDYLRGTLTSPTSLEPAGTVTITIECQKTVTQQRGKQTSIRFDSLWQHKEVVSMQRGADRASIVPIAIKIPSGLPSYGSPDSETTIKWTLTAKAQIPGVDFWASYDVPVFAPDTGAG